MEDWEADALFEWEEFEERQWHLYRAAGILADSVFLSDNDYLPSAEDDYNLGYLGPEDWWPLVNQLDEMLDLETVVELLDHLDGLLGFPGLPTELLEEPLTFLSGVLAGNLPREPSGRRVGSRRLVKIAQAMIHLVQQFPDTAQAAVRAWADVHRNRLAGFDFEDYDEEDLADLLSAADLPPALTGFSMMIGLTLMRWPERAEGLPLPPAFLDSEVYDEVLVQWETLPDSPTVTEEGSGEAEAFFAQGQLAHMLAQMGTVDLMASEEVGEVGEQDIALAYSRLSRAVLWIHNQCRHCPERDEVVCKVASNWPDDHPVSLLDVAGEIANTSRIRGCIKM